jgi:hypothetical protein
MYCEENIATTIEVFIHVIIVMAYVLNYFMWQQVCVMEAVVSTLRMFNIVSSFKGVVVLMISFIRTLKFIICGPDPKVCIYTNNVCNWEVFQILFTQFVWEAEYEKSVHSWWKKNVVLNTVSSKNILHFL